MGHPMDARARHLIHASISREMEELKRQGRFSIPRTFMKRWIVHDSKDSFLKHTNIDEGNLYDNWS